MLNLNRFDANFTLERKSGEKRKGVDSLNYGKREKSFPSHNALIISVIYKLELLFRVVGLLQKSALTKEQVRQRSHILSAKDFW
jgi:hypothetical protein